jgi:hypothetical protein
VIISRLTTIPRQPGDRAVNESPSESAADIRYLLHRTLSRPRISQANTTFSTFFTAAILSLDEWRVLS